MLFINGLSSHINNRVNGGFDSDYQAVLNRATTRGFALPTSSHLELQNSLVLNLKSAGIWNNLDLLYVFAVKTTDDSSNFTLLNWKSPANFELSLESSPSFSVSKGWSSAGTSRLNTGFTLDADGVNYTKDVAGAFALLTEMSSSSQTNQRVYGNDGSSNYFSPRIDVNGSSTSNRSWINSSQYQNNSPEPLSMHMKDNVMIFQNRPDSENINYRSTDLVNDTHFSDTFATNSQNLPSEDLDLLGARNSDTLKSGSTLGIFGLGTSLTDTQMDAVESALYTNYIAQL